MTHETIKDNVSFIFPLKSFVIKISCQSWVSSDLKKWHRSGMFK